MNKDLLIFPGGGSPENPLYHKVYDLLQTAAKNGGYERVSVLSWPGHSDRKNEFSSELSMSGAMEVALARIREQEVSSRSFDILARSFGTIVALSCARERHRALEKLILWGPPPFWLMWQMFVKDFDKNHQVALDKGCNISKEFFNGVVPFESLINDLKVETIVVTGTADPSCTPAFSDYLKAMSENNQQIHFRPVQGCKHEVTEDDPHWKEYVETLFR